MIKLKNILTELYGLGELPSSKLMKMKVSAKDMLDSVNPKKMIDGLEEGWVDVAKLIGHTQEFKTILTPGQSAAVINSTINQMINNMGGPADAAELIRGALESVDSIKNILKPLIAQDATLDVEMLNKIVDRLPFDEATKQQLQRSIMKLAQDLNVSTPDGNTSTGPRLA